jgi:hypothetical protein
MRRKVGSAVSLVAPANQLGAERIPAMADVGLSAEPRRRAMAHRFGLQYYVV